jgi:hypothetical protein
MPLSIIRRFLIWLGIGRETSIDGDSELLKVGRDEYKYVERGRSLLLQIEMLHGTPSKLIYSSTIKQWLPPHDAERISDDDRKRIAERIAQFLARQGESVEVE